MALEFRLPEIGEGMVEGEIVEWHVNPGDQVVADQTLVSVLTDKATVEIPASFDGVIESRIGEPGELVEVGAVLVTYSSDGAATAAKLAPAAAPKTEAHAEVVSQGSGSLVEFRLPEIGEGMVEGEIVEWLVAAGDTVSNDQTLVSILTDKATVEIPSPVTGKVVSRIGEAGEMVEVGAVLMTIEVHAGASGETTGAPAASAAPSVKTPAPQPQAAAKVPAPIQAKSAASSAPVVAMDNPSISSFGTPLATPSVRRLAAAQGIDLRGVRGSGPNHRILRSDVEAALNQASAPAAKPAAVSATPTQAPAAIHQPGASEKRVRVHGLRKAIIQNMAKAKRIIPHFTYVDEVEMDNLIAFRDQLKEPAAAEGIKLTYLPFIVKAAIQGLKKFPIMNASLDDEAAEIVYKTDYNIGIATATENGLMVPVLKHADQKNIVQIGTEISELSDRARKQRSTMEDIRGGTFTITSLGRLGGMFATPIINHPEVAILSIHNVQERAVVRDGQIVIRQMMNIAVSFDHRVVDGDVGASFAQEVKTILEHPSRLLLHMV